MRGVVIAIRAGMNANIGSLVLREPAENGERAVRGHRSQEIGAAATKRGTINALVVSYYKSPEFGPVAL